MQNIRLLISTLCLAMLLPAMTQAQEDPFEGLPETDTPAFDEDVLPDFEWNAWDEKDWEKAYRQDYRHYYQDKEARRLLREAYQQAAKQGFALPQRHLDYTYDPQTGQLIQEDESDYIERLGDWLNNMEDELTETGMNVALDLLYAELEPVLKVLKKKNAALLDKIIPETKGIPVHDPVEDQAKEKQEGKENFKYWVKLAAENVMQSLFKKNAEGKYELQREKIELLKQVGLIRFLKMAAMDWEVMQSITLEVPDEVLGYAEALRDVYVSGAATFEAGKALYRQISLLDTELTLPAQLDQLTGLAKDMTMNQLTVQEMVSRRKQLLAMTYRQLANRYQQYGEELNRQLRQDKTLKMEDAERVKALQIASDYLQESLRLQAKAARLMTDSYQPSGAAKEPYTRQQWLYNKLNEFY